MSPHALGDCNINISFSFAEPRLGIAKHVLLIELTHINLYTFSPSLFVSKNEFEQFLTPLQNGWHYQ